MMKTSNKGILEIAEHEGIVPAPYFDSAGVLTYGIGHTAAAGGVNPRDLNRGMPTNLEAALDHVVDLFKKDLRSYEARVNKAFHVPLKQHQFDALVSWDFNTGGATWRSPSTGKPCQLVQQINSGDMSGDGFMGWLRPPELRNRREAELNLFRTGDYDANGNRIPIWRVDEHGKIRGQFTVITGAELLKRMNKSVTPQTNWLQEILEWLHSISTRVR